MFRNGPRRRSTSGESMGQVLETTLNKNFRTKLLGTLQMMPLEAAFGSDGQPSLSSSNSLIRHFWKTCTLCIRQLLILILFLCQINFLKWSRRRSGSGESMSQLLEIFLSWDSGEKVSPRFKSHHDLRHHPCLTLYCKGREQNTTFAKFVHFVSANFWF